MNLSIGVSVAFSRFFSGSRTKRLQKIKDQGLNALELGLINCSVGKSTIPRTFPYPSESQSKAILEIFPPDIFYISIHGPYRISATSDDPNVLKFSKSNLSASLKVADWLGAHHITFHGGSFKRKHNNNYVKKVLVEWEQWRQEKGFISKFAPEVGGKYNSFADFFTLAEIAGSIENCLMTWDISHDFARGGNVTTEEGILKRLEVIDECFDLNKENRLPIHFSGMVVGKTGEKIHTLLDHGTGVPWMLIFSVLKQQNYLEKLNLICESKIPPEDKKFLKGDAISDAIKIRDFLYSDKIIKTYKGKVGHLDYYFS